MKTGYDLRNRFLRDLGFNTYTDYLDSDLWKSIRASVLARESQCRLCGNQFRLQIHHTKYTRRILSGQTTKGLVVLCRGCHYSTEFTKKKKLTLASAKKKFLSKVKNLEAQKKRKSETNAILRKGYLDGSLLPDKLPDFL